MRAITTSQISGDDKTIHLSIPVAKAGESYRITVSVEEENLTTRSEWPEGYLENAVGGWQGEFFIDDEGAFEVRGIL
jgi:hypothetical protein